MKWKRIKNFERYAISDTGVVLSFVRVTPRALRQITHGNGYLKVNLCRDARAFTKFVSHMVAAAFIGKRPKGQVVRHKDGNVFNNTVKNLCYGTVKQNKQDSIRHGTWVHGETNGKAKLTETQVRAIRKLLKNGKTQRSIALRFGVQKAAIHKIGKHRTWRHVS